MTEITKARKALKRTCKQCGHTWTLRGDNEPMKCPNRKCSNPFYWNRPRQTPRAPKEKQS